MDAARIASRACPRLPAQAAATLPMVVSCCGSPVWQATLCGHSTAPSRSGSSLTDAPSVQPHQAFAPAGLFAVLPPEADRLLLSPSQPPDFARLHRGTSSGTRLASPCPVEIACLCSDVPLLRPSIAGGLTSSPTTNAYPQVALTVGSWRAGGRKARMPDIQQK